MRIQYIFIMSLFSFFFTETTFAQKKKKTAKSANSRVKAKPAKKVVTSKKTVKGKKATVATKNNAKVASTQQTTSNVVVIDTATLPKEVVITSAFKPSLRNAAKINFTAATPLLDTVKVAQSYNIPSQSLFFSYQPIAIKPMAYSADTSIEWMNQQYIKLGFGNFSSPYVETGLAFGDGRKTMGLVHAKYQSAKGNLPFQEYNKLGVDVGGTFQLKKNHQLSGKVYFSNQTQYQYGFSPANSAITKDDIRQRFTTVGFDGVLKNLSSNAQGIQYQPTIKFNVFSANNQSNEINLLLKTPLQKKLNEKLTLQFDATADITSYNTSTIPNSIRINNNLWYVLANGKYTNEKFTITAGLMPSWDNKQFKLLPHVTADVIVDKQKMVAQFGWIGYFQKNSYQQLTIINPFIDPVTAQANTRIVEQFAGLKGSLTKHFTYNAKLSFVQMKNAILFNNNYFFPAQNFKALVSPQVQAIRLKGELGYSIQEKFAVLAAATYNQFTKVEGFDKAYGLVPLELNGSFRWKVLKDVQLKSDVLFMSGNAFTDNTTSTGKVKPAIDVNIGTEFLVMPKLNAWLQFNNLLNNKYQRWNQYEVLGFQVLAGVVYSFR